MTGLVIQVSGWLAEVAILEPSEVSMSKVLLKMVKELNLKLALGMSEWR